MISSQRIRFLLSAKNLIYSSFYAFVISCWRKETRSRKFESSRDETRMKLSEIPIAFWQLISRTFIAKHSQRGRFRLHRQFTKAFVEWGRDFLCPCDEPFKLAQTEESGDSSLNRRRTFVNCETTHGRRRDKLVQFRREILPFPASSKTKLNFLIIRTRGGKDCCSTRRIRLLLSLL